MEISVITEPSITVGGVPGERRWSGAGIRNRKWLNLSPKNPPPPPAALGLEMEMEEGSGGKMVVELVGAFNKLTTAVILCLTLFSEREPHCGYRPAPIPW